MRLSARFSIELCLAGLLMLAIWLAAGWLLPRIPLHFIAEIQTSHPDQLQLYVDRGQGFSEASVLRIDLHAGVGWQTINQPLPPGLHALRIDPLRGAGQVRAKRLQLCRLAGCVDVLTAASQLAGTTIDPRPDGQRLLRLSGDDPQIVLAMLPALDARTAHKARWLWLAAMWPLIGLLLWARHNPASCLSGLRNREPTCPRFPTSTADQPQVRQAARHRAGSRRSAAAALPASVFLLLSWLPLLVMPLNLFDISERYELRHKASRPEFNLSEWAQFPSRFEAWFNDHFGLRGHLVAAGNWLTLSLFPGDSPDKRVLIGQQDWLYFSGQPALSSMQDHQGRRPFTTAELETIRLQVLRRQAWLAERGIPYLLVIAPNKESLYPEYLPTRYRSTIGPSRLDQLAEWLQRNPAPNWIDLRPHLRQAKAGSALPLFYRTDSHWNKLGAWFGYQAIFNTGHRLGWTPQPVPASQFTLHSQPGFMGDLAQMLLARHRFADTAIEIKPRTPCRLTVDRSEHTAFAPFGRDLRRYHAECSSSGTLLMLHDSFSWNLIPYIAPHYRNSYFVQQSGFPVGLIDHVQPAIVIQEYVERDLQLILAAAQAGELQPTSDPLKAKP